MEIAKFLSVSSRTLWKWRRDNDYEDPRENDLLPEELDELVLNCVRSQPDRGEKIVRATLEAQGIFVTRSNLRASIHRVDPEGVEARKSKPIKRRVYSVAGPHHLWHIDGNHKLIRYHIVIHAGIDGFSRAVMYVGASDNNRSETVLHLFVEATKTFGIPSRVRSDKGGENTKVADFMLRHRGLGRRSVLTGKSVHNQRIERFWRDLSKDVIGFYKRLFQAMEIRFLIDFDDPINIFCLHYCFLLRINQDVKQYAETWNCHKIRTEHSRSPLQLLVLHDDQSAAVEAPVFADYGAENDEYDDEESEEEEFDQVILPPIQSPLDPDYYAAFSHYFQPLENTVVHPNEMVNYFLNALSYCRQLLLHQHQHQHN